MGAPQPKSPLWQNKFDAYRFEGSGDINVLNLSLRLNKEILFKKLTHLFHSLKMIFQNSRKARMTHFNIPVAITTAEIIDDISNGYSKKVLLRFTTF